MPEWTDESREELEKQYLAENPTPETSMEIIKKLAPDFDATPNGVGAILRKRGVYVKKAAAKATASTSSGEKKESKQDSIDRLATVLKANAVEVDDSILSKLTGKAAAYFADSFNKVLATDEQE